MRWCELPQSVQTHSILMWKVDKEGHRKPTLTPPVTGKHVAVTIIEHIYQSLPSPTIHYTYGETLEGLSWCELLESVQTHSILMWKVEEGQARFVPTRDWKTCCDDHFRAHIPISTFSNHSLYLWWEVGRVKLVWNSLINPNILRLRCETRRSLMPKSSPPMTQKPGCGDGCGWWIQISSLQNHSLYLQWDIERVEMLWMASISPNSRNLGVKSGKRQSQLWPHRWLKNTSWLPF